MSVVLAGSQTGNKDDYARLKEMCDEGTVIVDDSNPVELSKFILEKEADLLIGGVKERPIAFKLGIGFCDHNRAILTTTKERLDFLSFRYFQRTNVRTH